MILGRSATGLVLLVSYLNSSVLGELGGLRGQTCIARASCEECLAEGSGCYGWQGATCCHRNDCLPSDVNGTLYTSCAAWDQDQTLAMACAAVQQHDSCMCVDAGCVSQVVQTGEQICSHRLEEGVVDAYCTRPGTPSMDLEIAAGGRVLDEWASAINLVISNPTIGLVLGTSISILGVVVRGDNFTFTADGMRAVAVSWAPAIAGMVHPALGMALTFAFSFFSGLSASEQATDPLHEMYQRIMSEVEMKVDTGFFRHIILTQLATMEETLRRLKRLPKYVGTGKHSPSEQYMLYRVIRDEIEGVISTLIKSANMFKTEEQRQRYHATVLPLMLTCFDILFSVSSEMMVLRPELRAELTSELKERVVISQSFMDRAVEHTWLVRRRSIFALQWVDHVISGPSYSSWGSSSWNRDCDTKGAPKCIDGFTGDDACQEMNCRVGSGSWTITGPKSSGVKSCEWNSGLCRLNEHSRLLASAESSVRHQHDLVEAVVNFDNQDYNFRDSVCNKMNFSLDSVGFERAVNSSSLRVMSCYIRQVATSLRPELGVLDNWIPAKLREVAEEFLVEGRSLVDLNQTLSEIAPSPGNAPDYTLPDNAFCPVRETRFDPVHRISETSAGSRSQCERACASTPGCHCIEYYYGQSTTGGGCVLVSKGASRWTAPWYWTNKPTTVRLGRCTGTQEGRLMC